MKKIDKLFPLVLMILIIINPILDLLTSISIKLNLNIISFGILLRAIILILLIIYIIFNKKMGKNKIVLILLSIVTIYSLLFATNILMIKESFFIKELIQYFKIIYFPILFILIYYFNKENIFKIEIKHLMISVSIYSLLIIIPYLTNNSFLSYSHSKVGTVGWFYAANEIGNIIAICMPFVFEYIFSKNKISYKIIVTILILFSVIILGTKTPFLSLLICLFVYYIILFVKSFKDRKKLCGFILITLALVISLITVPYTPFYKNIESHYKYQNVNNIKEIITNPKKIDHFIFGERFKFLNNTKSIYLDSKLSTKLLGIGYYDLNGLEYKTVEMDFADIYFRSGIVMFVLIYLIIPVIFIIDILKKNIKHKISYILSLILALVISIIVGHVFTAPSVVLYVIIIMVMFYNKCRGVEQ